MASEDDSSVGDKERIKGLLKENEYLRKLLELAALKNTVLEQQLKAADPERSSHQPPLLPPNPDGSYPNLPL